MRWSEHYAELHENVDPDVHLREAIGWIKRAQDFGTDCGVSWGTKFGHGFRPSYPETTGYIICTFVELAKIFGTAEYLERAIAMGLWEVAVQMESGAVMGGLWSLAIRLQLCSTPGKFCSAGPLYTKRRVMSDLHERGERAAAWMMSMQEPNGSWIRGNSNYAAKDATLYNVKAAWGLARMGRATSYEEAVRTAVRNAEYTVARQAPNGWFPDCCLSDPRQPLLHTIAYAMQGLLGLGQLTGRKDFIASATVMANNLLKLMDVEGFIPGRINSSIAGTVKWCCLTGMAQTSIVWSWLYEITRQEGYREAVRRANRYLMARHDIGSADSAIRGGLAGSWPIWGGYCPLMVTSWAAKFFIDALVAEKRINVLPVAGRTDA